MNRETAERILPCRCATETEPGEGNLCANCMKRPAVIALLDAKDAESAGVRERLRVCEENIRQAWIVYTAHGNCKEFVERLAALALKLKEKG